MDRYCMCDMEYLYGMYYVYVWVYWMYMLMRRYMWYMFICLYCMVYVRKYIWWICAMYMREACGSNVCMRGICIRSIIMDMLELFYMTKDKGRNMWLVWNDYIDMNR